MSAIIVSLPSLFLLVLFNSLSDHLYPIATMIFGISIPAFIISFFLFSGLKEVISCKKRDDAKIELDDTN